MTLPVLHPLSDTMWSCYTASVGATPVAAHIVAPWRCKIMQVASVLGGVITTANASVAVAINGTAVTGATLDIEDSGSAVGDLDTATPTAANVANEGDVISFTPSLASGSSIPCHFFAMTRRL